MPDIEMDDDDISNKSYSILSEKQKDLIQEIVKPEADALEELLGSELEDTGKLENLKKHKQKTILKIDELLSSGVSYKQIKHLIWLLCSSKWDSRMPGADAVDDNEVMQTSIDIIGFDCGSFEWTLKCLDILHGASIIQKRFRAYKEGSLTRKSLGIFTDKQKQNDWQGLKHKLKREGFTDEQIEYFKINHYFVKAGNKKKRKKKKSKKKRKKKKSKKKSK